MKTLQETFTPVLDFLVAHCTGLSLLYTRLAFKTLRPDPRMLAMKDRYSGRRCFVIGLGPSLSTDDLDLLAMHGEYCFSMNRCYQLFNRTVWRPDCYFISDGRVNNRTTQDEIRKMLGAGIDVVYSRLEIRNMPKEAVYYKADFQDFILSNSRSERYRRKGHECRFSTDAGDFIYDGHSSALSIVQLAYFMGFKEVYLLGLDCGTSPSTGYCEGISAPQNVNQGSDLDKVIRDFISLDEDMKSKGLDFKVFNCTRGGRLEVFPRRRLEDVLS